MKSLIKKILSKKYGLVTIIIVLFIGTYILLFTNPKDWQNFYYTILNSNVKSSKLETATAKQSDSPDSSENKVYADLNGDGKQETLQLILGGADGKSPSVVSLIAYNENGKEIGRLPESMPIQVPMPGSGKVYTPIKKDKNQFVSFDFVVGPHSSETMFLGLFKLKAGGMGVLPVCLTDNVQGDSDCLFWSGEVGGLIAKDLDNDGTLEVIETVDEYPKDGPITAAIEKIVNEQFKNLSQDAENGMIRILKREQGGRGNKVVWEVYRFNGNFFEEQTSTDYDKYYNLVSQYLKTTYPTYPTIMRKDAMSKDSLEYNEFLSKFWTHR